MKEMKRVMLDTNTYEFIRGKYFPDLMKLIDSNKLVVYGCKIVRDELRRQSEAKNFF